MNRIAAHPKLAAVLLALVLTACAVAPPTPLPTATATPAPSPTPTVVDCRQEAVTRDYDMTARTTVKAVGQPDYAWPADDLIDPTYQARVSGADFHMVASTEAEGVVGETIRVGDTYYDRNTGQPWKSRPHPAGRPKGAPFSPFADNPTCPDLTSLAGWNALGKDTVDGAQLRRFKQSGPVNNETTDGRVSFDQEIWVDDAGRLAQYKTVEVYRCDQCSPRVMETVAVVTFSGIGEANLITAPVQ